MFEEMRLIAKVNKIDHLRQYCRENHIDCCELASNIPSGKIDDFDKFLIESQILEEKTNLNIAIPTKNKSLLLELENFIAKNSLQIEKNGTSARIIGIPIILVDSDEWQELSGRLEEVFNAEMEEQRL